MSKPEQPDVDSEFSAACAKVHLIGSKRVVEGIIGLERIHRRFSREASARKWDHEKRLKSYEPVLDEMNEVHERIECLSIERTNIVKQIETFNAGNKTDTIEGEKLTGLVKAWEEKRQELIARLKSLQAATFETARADDLEKFAIALECIAKMQTQVEPLLYELVVAMKKDLGIDIDERWYFKQMAEESEESQESIRHHIETVFTVRRLQKKVEHLERLAPAKQQTNGSDSQGIRRDAPQ